MRPEGWSALCASMSVSSFPTGESGCTSSRKAHAAATRTLRTGSFKSGRNASRAGEGVPGEISPKVCTAAARTSGLSCCNCSCKAMLTAGSPPQRSRSNAADAFHAAGSSLLSVAIKPSRAPSSPRFALANKVARSRVRRFIFSPNHCVVNVSAHDASLSAWQRLQALGMPKSFVSFGSGMVKPWSWRGWRCM